MIRKQLVSEKLAELRMPAGGLGELKQNTSTSQFHAHDIKPHNIDSTCIHEEIGKSSPNHEKY